MSADETLLEAAHRQAEHDAEHAVIVADFERVCRTIYKVLDTQRKRIDQLEAIATSQGQRLEAVNDLLGEELERAKRVER